MLNLDKSTWTTHRFGDLVRNRNETVKDVPNSGIEHLIALEHLDPGEIRIRRYGAVADGTTFTRRVRPGQTLFGKRRAYQRKAAYAEADAICSGDILVFEAVPKVLAPRLLPFLVHSETFFDHALVTSAGSLSPRTNWGALADFEVALPPFDEQERIADLLWALEEHRSAVSSGAQAMRVASSRLLDAYFHLHGTMRPLGEIVSGVVDCPHSTAPSHDSDFARLVGTPDVRDGVLNLASCRPVSEETYVKRTQRAAPRPGDLIFTREAPVGEVCILPQDVKICLGQRTVLIQPANREDGRVVWAALQSEGVQRTVRLKSAGSTVPHLNVADVRKLEVPWVAEPSGRGQVLHLVEQINTSTVSTDVELVTLATLRSSLLAEIFGGVA